MAISKQSDKKSGYSPPVIVIKPGSTHTSKPGRVSLLRWIFGILFVISAIFAGLVLDGLSREKLEFNASIADLQGNVTLIAANNAGRVAAAGDKLDALDTVITGNGATAVIVMHDGSSIQLEPNTKLHMTMLDYTRNGKREHNFMVDEGGVVARVSRFFGVSSRQSISTPTAVAAARGTGYRMNYNPIIKSAMLEVIEHDVDFSSNYVTHAVPEGNSMTAMANHSVTPGTINTTDLSNLQAAFTANAKYEIAPKIIETVEKRLVQFVLPLLELFGNGPQGLTDSERLDMCRFSLEKIRSKIESDYPTTPPVTLNPVTLEELNLEDSARLAILRSFSGAILSAFEQTADGSCIISAYARDSKRTLFSVSTRKYEITVNAPEMPKKEAPVAPSGRWINSGLSLSPANDSYDLPEDENPVVTGKTDEGIEIVGEQQDITPVPADSAYAAAMLTASEIGDEWDILGSTEEIFGPQSAPLTELPFTESPVPSIAVPGTNQHVITASITQPEVLSTSSGGFAGIGGGLLPALATAFIVTENRSSQDQNHVVPEPTSMLSLTVFFSLGGLSGYLKNRIMPH